MPELLSNDGINASLHRLGVEDGRVLVDTPVGRLPAVAVVAANVAFWPAWTAAVGYLAQRTPDARFACDDVLTRPRPFEQDGSFYRDSLQIQRWKDRLPEAGTAFGGFAKRSVSGGDPEVLERFVVETRRAEHAHWGMAAGVALTLLWNPWWAAPINATVAGVSNLPCIAVQRYNRARLRRTLSVIGRRATSS
jgi:glycosyl-4,4'-diaponeurosporenoate acyltransferase